MSYPIQGYPGHRADTGDRFYHPSHITNGIEIFYLVFINGHGKYVKEDSWEYQESRRVAGRMLYEYMRPTRTARRLEKAKKRILKNSSTPENKMNNFLNNRIAGGGA